MTRSLPFRLFLVHLVFTLGAGYVAVVLVARSFERYAQTWQREVAASFAENLYRPLAAEVARSLLLSQESEFPEVREQRRTQIAAGLRTVLRDVRGLRAIVVVDRDQRIQFASDESVSDLTYTKPEDREFLASDTVRSRIGPGKPEKPGELAQEVVIPVFDDLKAGPPRRLGAVLVRLVPDAALIAQVAPREVRAIPWKDFALPVIVFLAAAAAGGVVMAGLTGLPVHRLDRALKELRARGFRGGLDATRLGVGGELASAVQAINELGGRIEALDARGREREALLDTLSHSLEDGMLALTPTGIPAAWNPSAVRILGASTPADWVPTPELEIDPALTSALAGNPELVARARETTGTFEVQIHGADGRERPIKVTSFPFEAGPGETGTLLLLRDITTLRTLEAHLVDAGRFAVIAHLGAGLAHEIRNPLHSIGLNATVVEQYVGRSVTAKQTAEMLESLSTIREETQRLADLLNSYLGLVRPEAVAGPVDLATVFRRVRQLLGFPAKKSKVEIRIDVPESLPAVHGLADRLQQAVINLVLNAIQAMPTGGEVTLTARAAGDLVRVTVMDTGPGVPEEIRDRIFEGGVSTKSGGTGLGLPLVRMIAASHGGTVAYRGAASHGAVFVLELPTGPPG